MNDQPSSLPLLDPENKIKALLAEYDAIEHMHSHYDVINMSLTAIISAGVFTVWGSVLRTAYQSNHPLDNSVFVNSISILALTIFVVLSIWIRYLTIHRCIVIRKLNRSHEIEHELEMKQNSIFKYDPSKLTKPLDSNDDSLKRRPGGHTLELLLYISLSTLGLFIALQFQFDLKSWNLINYLAVGVLLISPVVELLWMSFCKMDALHQIEGKVIIGLPWNLLFHISMPVNREIRKFLNKGEREF